MIVQDLARVLFYYVSMATPWIIKVFCQTIIYSILCILEKRYSKYCNEKFWIFQFPAWWEYVLCTKSQILIFTQRKRLRLTIESKIPAFTHWIWSFSETAVSRCARPHEILEKTIQFCLRIGNWIPNNRKLLFFAFRFTFSVDVWQEYRVINYTPLIISS